MNVRLLLAASAVALLLPACATMDSKDAAVKKSHSSVDESYVARVERAARNRGITVVWVHQPTTRPDDDD